MKHVLTGLLLTLCAMAATAQTTSITANSVSFFGSGAVTGQFCVTAVDSSGNPTNLIVGGSVTFYAGQQQCASLNVGVLSSMVVPDVSAALPAGACYQVIVTNTNQTQSGQYPCIKPSGSTWSFDAYVSGLSGTVTLPQFKVNGALNATQGTVNFVGSGVTYSAGGNVNIATGTSSYVSYLAAGLLAPGYGHVDSSMVTYDATTNPTGVDAFQAINTVASTLPSGSMLDAYALGTATFTVVHQLTALNQANKGIVLLQNNGTRFQINTVFSSPTNTPASCAVPVGGAGAGAGSSLTGSAIIVPGYNSLAANYFLGPSARVQDVVCNGDFLGNQENLHLDGVVIEGNQSATMSGALLHLAGVFVPTSIVNTGTIQCFGQCVEIDAGTTGTGGSSISDLTFINDNFEDGYTGTATYPGSVLGFDALSSAGGVGNINFYGGMVELNGPHNALVTVKGRGSVQVGSLGFFGTTFQGAAAAPAATYSTTATASIAATSITVASATNLAAWQVVTGTGIASGTFVAGSYTSGTTIPLTKATTASLSATAVTFYPNVDPLQFYDASSVSISNLKYAGNNNNTYQQHLVDIFGTTANAQFGFNLNQIVAYTGNFTCLVANNVEGTCEAGYPTGFGDTALPNYSFGQLFPVLRQTNYAPPAATTGSLGTIWTNSTATSGAALLDKLVSSTPTWVALDVQNAPAVAHQFVSAYAAATGTLTQSAIGAADTAGGGYAAAAGSVNVLTATLSPVPSALVTGMEINILPNLANTTTTPTLNLNSLGAVTITKNGTAALAAGDLTTTAIANLLYDGTRWQLLNPQTSASASLPSSAAHTFLGNNTGSTATASASAIGAQDVAGGGYIAATGSVNVLAATLSPAPTSLVSGLEINILPNLANTTTTPTLNVNGLGAATITKNGTAALAAGDLSTTAIAKLLYDGTRWQLQNPQTTPAAALPSTGAHLFIGNNTATTATASAQAIGSQDMVGNYIAAGGTANAQTAAFSPAITSLVAGLEVYILPVAANTTSTPTLAVNGLTATVITKNGSAALAVGDLSTTAIADLFYDGTRWQLTNPQTQTGTVTNAAALTSNAVVIGGGAGAESTISTDTTTTHALMATAGAPAFRALAYTDLPTIGAHTVVGNSGSSTATPLAITLGAQDVSPGSYLASSGSVNVYTATMSPAVTSYVSGELVTIKFNLANTTSTPTINLNGLGAKTIVKYGATALAINDLTTTAVAQLIYDGTNFQLLNPQTPQGSNASIQAGSAAWGIYGINQVIGSMKANYAGTFTALALTNLDGGSCTTPPAFNVFDGTSNTGTALTAITTAQTKGTATTNTQTLAFSAGDIIGIYISTAGASCAGAHIIVTASITP